MSTLRLFLTNGSPVKELPTQDAAAQDTVDSPGDGEFRMHLTLPAAAQGHDISVMVTPHKKPHAGRTSHATPQSPPPPFSLASSVSDTSTDLGGDGSDPFQHVAHIAAHLRADRIRLSGFECYKVPPDLRARYPPGPFSNGWNRMKWYVVWRGRDIGIFFDFW